MIILNHSGIEATARMYNSVLLAAANARSPLKVALKVYEDMTKKSKLEPNVHTFGALITGCARAGDSAKAMAFL